MKAGWISGLAVLALGGAAALATPSYTAVFLPTGGNTSTYAVGIDNGQIVGYSQASTFHALLWNSPYSQPIDLNPSGDINSQAGSTDGNYQTGRALTAAGTNAAVVWQGSAASVITLIPPAGFTGTAIGNMANGQITGGGTAADGSEHAVIWNGINSTGIDVNPSGYTQSAIRATNGQQQVGYGVPTGQSEQVPLLWSGTADSALDISPAGYSDSRAYAISGNLVVGYGSPGTGQQDALLWNITTGTVTDLEPTTLPDFFQSAAYAVAGQYETGYGMTGNYDPHALLWTGSGDSAVDLNTYLPSGYDSYAYGVDANGDVVGVANNGTGWQAVVWLAPEPNLLPMLVIGSYFLSGRRPNKSPNR